MVETQQEIKIKELEQDATDRKNSIKDSELAIAKLNCRLISAAVIVDIECSYKYLMAYSGKFSPKNTNKYLGDPTTVWYRSLWERRVMVRLDDDPNVIEWSNEEIIIPYLSPIDGRWHRYFPDFFVRVKNRHGVQEAMILEVKPLKQAVPPQVKKRITRQYIQEVATYGINEAKWKAATEYCKDRNWSFKVITEKDLGI